MKVNPRDIFGEKWRWATTEEERRMREDCERIEAFIEMLPHRIPFKEDIRRNLSIFVAQERETIAKTLEDKGEKSAADIVRGGVEFKEKLYFFVKAERDRISNLCEKSGFPDGVDIARMIREG